MSSQQPYRRGNPVVLVLSTMVALVIASTPITGPAVHTWAQNERTDALAYKQQNGRWDVVDLPEEYRLNTIHAALMPTGKVLLVAGSGNNRENFESFYDDGKMEVLKTAIFDPETNQMEIVPTPVDLFCGGHASLQSGNLLIAGGTSGYEQLKGTVTKPAGTMIVHNENPDSKKRELKKGTKFTSPAGKKYVLLKDTMVEPAHKMTNPDGSVVIHQSSVKAFVEAEKADAAYATTAYEHFKIEGMKGSDINNIYGQGGPMTYDKQDYRGDNKSFEFNPYTESYEVTGDLNESRWYPTLTVLTNGKVLAVSGLDATGKIANTTEQYDPATKQWSWGLPQAFPSYPALFRTMNPDQLFYSGSNAGYGPANIGRTPGYWNYKTNEFKAVEGLTDPHILETSASVALPPVQGSNDGSQSYRIMVAGGGGVGESPLVTSRTATIDLSAAEPRFTTGTPLPSALRYPNLTVMPWDEVLLNGGSADYRGRGNTYSKTTASYNPTTGSFTKLADEIVPRSYHSGSLLLPDGRVMVFGNDALFADKNNTRPSTFEQRLEIFTPPQLYKGDRPSLTGKSGMKVQRGQELTFDSKDPMAIRTARLIPPSNTTHVTNIEQRSVAAVVRVVDGRVAITLPEDENLLPNGWYMLFVTNQAGTPNKAIMIQVVR